MRPIAATKSPTGRNEGGLHLAGFLERYFDLAKHGTTVRRELLGGLTTFAAMAYIIVVNPAILQGAFHDVPTGALTVATVVSAVFGCLLMGLYANRPIAVAPYMGENAFIAYALAATIGWQLRLGSVFIAGLVFMVITVLGLRAWLAQAISPSLKHSFGVGIGLFLAFIGLVDCGIVAHGPPQAPPVMLAVPFTVEMGLSVFGFCLIAVLMCLKVRGAILIGIVGTGVLGYLIGHGKAPDGIAALPFVGEYDIRPVAFHLDIAGVLRLEFLPVLLTLILVSFLDTLGTLIAVGDAGGMLDKEGNLPEMERPMLVDAISCVFSSLVGTSTSGAFIESAAGVREGARTGLAAVTTGLLFALALFFLPLFAPLQQFKYAYGPALIAVGVLMMSSVVRIQFDDPTEAVPAFATIVLMVFTFNIANGLTAGLILHPLLKLGSGRWREVNVGALVLAALCVVYYVFGLPH
jgi:AGZA family xanthine/uracil permease-like MFS transporter